MKCHEAACCKQGPDRGSSADRRPARQGLPFPPSPPPAHQGQPALQAPLALIDDVTGDTQGAAQAFGQEHVGVSSAGQQLLHNLGTDRPVSTRRAPPQRAEEAPGARPRGATSLLPTPRGCGSDGEAGGAHGGSLGRTPTPPGGRPRSSTSSEQRPVAQKWSRRLSAFHLGMQGILPGLSPHRVRRTSCWSMSLGPACLYPGQPVTVIT